MRKPVYVEISDGKIIAIFKNRKRAMQSHVGERGHLLDLQPYAVAVSAIREQVFERAEELCEACGVERATEMDERLARGEFDENGWSGQISLANSRALCNSCHQGPAGHHGNRRPRLKWLTLNETTE